MIVGEIEDEFDTEIDESDESEMAALADAKFSKLKKKINANNWTIELEDLMQSWGEKAAGYREVA